MDAGQQLTVTWDEWYSRRNIYNWYRFTSCGTFCWTPTSRWHWKLLLFSVGLLDDACALCRKSDLVPTRVNVMGLNVGAGPDQQNCMLATWQHSMQMLPEVAVPILIIWNKWFYYASDNSRVLSTWWSDCQWWYMYCNWYSSGDNALYPDCCI